MAGCRSERSRKWHSERRKAGGPCRRPQRSARRWHYDRCEKGRRILGSRYFEEWHGCRIRYRPRASRDPRDCSLWRSHQGHAVRGVRHLVRGEAPWINQRLGVERDCKTLFKTEAPTPYLPCVGRRLPAGRSGGCTRRRDEVVSSWCPALGLCRQEEEERVGGVCEVLGKLYTPASSKRGRRHPEAWRIQQCGRSRGTREDKSTEGKIRRKEARGWSTRRGSTSIFRWARTGHTTRSNPANFEATGRREAGAGSDRSPVRRREFRNKEKEERRKEISARSLDESGGGSAGEEQQTREEWEEEEEKEAIEKPLTPEEKAKQFIEEFELEQQQLSQIASTTKDGSEVPRIRPKTPVRAHCGGAQPGRSPRGGSGSDDHDQRRHDSELLPADHDPPRVRRQDPRPPRARNISKMYRPVSQWSASRGRGLPGREVYSSGNGCASGVLAGGATPGSSAGPYSGDRSERDHVEGSKACEAGRTSFRSGQLEPCARRWLAARWKRKVDRGRKPRKGKRRQEQRKDQERRQERRISVAGEDHTGRREQRRNELRVADGRPEETRTPLKKVRKLGMRDGSEESLPGRLDEASGGSSPSHALASLEALRRALEAEGDEEPVAREDPYEVTGMMMQEQAFPCAIDLKAAGKEVQWDPYLIGAPENSTPSAVDAMPSRALKNTEWCEWKSLTELGLQLMQGISKGKAPVGLEDILSTAKHHASHDAFQRSSELFPLPVDFEGGHSPCIASRAGDDGAKAWVPLICWTLNKLAGKREPFPRRRKSKQVVRVVEALRQRVERFLEGDVEKVWNCSALWEEIKKKRVNYMGEELSQPEPLSLEQIQQSVPPKGHGASVELTPWLTGKSQHLVLHPEECILAAEEKAPGRNRGRVHVKAGEELKVFSFLEDRGVIEWVPLEDVFADKDGPFLAGMFGVQKPGKFCKSGAPVLRVIMNLKNINRALKVIKGDISHLPAATSWTQLILEEGTVLEISQADMQSAFYLFKMPSQWRPYFCFNQIFRGDQVNMPQFKAVVPSCSVLPMGWASSVGLMQMVSRELMRNISAGPGAELRRGALVPKWFISVLKEGGTESWWQVYLDNFMAGGKRHVRGEPTKVEKLHGEAVMAWTEAGVLSAEDKHVFETRDAVELGVNIRGDTGLVGSSCERMQKLAQVTILLLGMKLPKPKWVQVILGRWVFVLQYRRPAMSILCHSWRYIQAAEDRRRWWPYVKSELSKLVLLLPLLQTDLRLPCSPLVTCSDASESGGAVAVSTRVTAEGQGLLRRLELSQCDPPLVEVLVISLFNGIGGSFRGYDLCGVRAMGMISVECDKSACRVTRKCWPSVIEIKDVNEITRATVEEWSNLFPRVKEVHTIGGFPCVHLSRVRAGRKNLEGPGSNLFWKMKDIIDWVEAVFSPRAVVEFLVENVLSMDSEARNEISAVLDVKPLALCPSDVLCYGRPRLAWCSREMIATEGVQFEDCGDYVRVWMTQTFLRDEQWIEPGWQKCDQRGVFSTFMKSIPRWQPPPAPAGLNRCSEEALARWRDDEFRFPPYQYEVRNLVKNSQGALRYLNSSERERLLGFSSGHTFFAFNAGEKKLNPQGYVDKRLSLLGDSFSMLSFGWIIAQLCSAWVPPMSPAEVIGRFGLAPGSSLARGYTAELAVQVSHGDCSAAVVAPEALVAHFSRHVNHTGCDVNLTMGTPFSNKTGNHSSIRAGWWDWRILFKTKWRFQAHINALEMRMVLQSVKWRARFESSIGCRWLHLADSMVTNYVLAKGRTSSHRLQPVTREIAAHLLALGSQQMMGHVDSLENLTDEASRE